MQDIIFKEFYERQVQNHISAVIQKVQAQASVAIEQAQNESRQQGWSDVLQIISQLQAESKDVSIQNIIEQINEKFA
jgi:hypothetical protein